MKPLLLLAVAALAACSAVPRPIVIDDEPRTTRRPGSDADEERRAREALEAIQKRVEHGDLPRIQFEFDKDVITPESYETLDLVAELLGTSGRLKLYIMAHTDAVGADEYNLDLSRRRAHSVQDYLASKGVPPPSMRFHGYGASKPIADNATEEGRARNRRVEFYVTTRDWNAVY